MIIDILKDVTSHLKQGCEGATTVKVLAVNFAAAS
jgi:hypothetical protein